MKEKIMKLGGKEWIKDDMERVYITNDIFNILREDLDLCAACFGERNNKIFFDVKKNAVLRSYKGKKPEIEIQY